MSIAGHYYRYVNMVFVECRISREIEKIDSLIFQVVFLFIKEYIFEKFTVERNDDDIELSSRSSNHQAEIVGQGPSNSIPTTMNKHLSPPNKTREPPPTRKIILHCNIKFFFFSFLQKEFLHLLHKDIRLHSRRNDITPDEDLFDSHSIISADSIERNETNDSNTKINTYSPIKTFLNQWNTPKTPLLETTDTETKDFLSVSPFVNRKPEIVKHIL